LTPTHPPPPPTPPTPRRSRAPSRVPPFFVPPFGGMPPRARRRRRDLSANARASCGALTSSDGMPFLGPFRLRLRTLVQLHPCSLVRHSFVLVPWSVQLRPCTLGPLQLCTLVRTSFVLVAPRFAHRNMARWPSAWRKEKGPSPSKTFPTRHRDRGSGACTELNPGSRSRSTGRFGPPDHRTMVRRDPPQVCQAYEAPLAPPLRSTRRGATADPRRRPRGHTH
jgi:hypothetical protein